MNNGTVKSTAFSGKGPVGVNSFGISQNAFAGVDDDILAIYVIFKFSFHDIEVFQIFMQVIGNNIVLVS